MNEKLEFGNTEQEDFEWDNVVTRLAIGNVDILLLEIYRDLLKQLYITDVYGSQFNPFVNPWNEMHVKLETEIQTINTILK